MRLLIIILCFFITSCNMDCVEPGLQSRDISFHVEVPLRKDDANSVMHWVDSEQVISKGESIKFNVNGEIDFCPKKKGKNPVEILVPAVFCADGSEPNYDQAKYINKVEDNFGKDLSSLCLGVFQKEEIKRRYIDSKIKVNPGDKLTFSLIPRKMKINCNNLQGVTLDENYYLDNKCKQKASTDAICKGGKFFIQDKNKCVESDLKSLEDKDSKDNEYDILVGNGYTPYDNKVHFNVEHIKDNSPWKIGSLLDLRRHKIALNKVVSSKDKNDSEEKKYNSYELNCYNQNICYNDSGMWNGTLQNSHQNCVSSIRYGKYDAENKCNMYSYFESIEDKIEKLKGSGQNEKDSWAEDLIEKDSWAEALIAKISATSIVIDDSTKHDDMDYDSQGTQCLPKGNSGICTDVTEDFKDFSLKLDHEYEVQSHVKHESSVMLAIANNGDRSANRGGYHVKVSKSCISNQGNKLYLYIGNDRPKGDKIEGYEVAKISEQIGGGIKYYKQDGEYTIEARDLLGDKPQKIYFGVDLRDIEKSDITDSNRDYYENNQYTVTLNLKKNVNNFLSSSVDRLMQFVKGSESQGDGIANTVRETYEGYRKGLVLTVRALLILYLMFSVIGYMLGTVQLNNYDFIIRITKIAFIAFAFSDKSWEIL